MYRRLPLLLIAFLAANVASAETDAQALALAGDKGCLACHGMVRQQIGPGFAQIAARYRNNPAAAAQLAAKIRNGSVGAWGRVIMPRQAGVTDADAKALAQWVLSRPPPP